MAQSNRERALIAAGIADTALVVWRGFKGKTPSKLPPPGEFPLIFLAYGALYMLADSETLGMAAVAFGWLLVMANFLNVGNVSNLLTDLGKPSASTTSSVTAPTPPTAPTATTT
jgi:hypothetical protein